MFVAVDVRDFHTANYLQKDWILQFDFHEKQILLYLMAIRWKSNLLLIRKHPQKIFPSFLFECDRVLWAGVYTAYAIAIDNRQVDMNNCPVGHIPLGKWNAKMRVLDWLLCLSYCLWVIMQYDTHQILNNYFANINFPIILVIWSCRGNVGNVRKLVGHVR